MYKDEISDTRPLNAPRSCDGCLEPGDTHNELEITTGQHFNLCPTCREQWEADGALFA